MILSSLIAGLLFGPVSLAQGKEWEPGHGLVQLPIWSNGAPGPANTKSAESVVEVSKKLVGGRPWLSVLNVSRPTITVYPPHGKPTGTSVIVFPGGGYSVLAIDLEGTEICEWLSKNGVAAILLKYRVPTALNGKYRESVQALQDAQRAISLARSRAADFKISPRKIGVIGFSAGGHLVAATSTQFGKRAYPAKDSVDKVSCRPDFAIAVYPGHISGRESVFDRKSNRVVLPINSSVSVTAQTPPTILVQAQDDPTDDPVNSIAYFAALTKAKVPAELHLFERGGHAFGLRPANQPVDAWPGLVLRWMTSRGLL